ncbi:cupin domain-containing protein [Streptomyces sp. PLAI1-29]|uniref:Cupin domain-containing protein n=1 Tax=Streptomyces zingiberis TaxID=2053010 RepID=A0ABX1BR70_9ACTN|nr:pirin family protein [Streptomyces zingiberis]NJP99542.1 cupin domain-containing protein [Streptomyces zingiberis]
MSEVWRAEARYRGGDGVTGGEDGDGTGDGGAGPAGAGGAATETAGGATGEAAPGIVTLHAFSFGRFYDPDNLRFGPLIACNEERLAPGAGFAAHRHRDTEIVTWVVEGELTHRDSAGHTTVVRPGDVQRLGAGSGVEHEERNDGDRTLVFVQMWLTPREPGGEPEYEIVRGLAERTPFAVERSGAVLHLRRPAAGARVALPDAPRSYVHVTAGALRLDGAGDGGGAPAEPPLTPGDALRLTAPRSLTAEEPSELLVWELP